MNALRTTRACIVVALLAFTASPILADQAASPAPAPSASAAPLAAVVKTFDPCGGPAELINKLGNGTACVFVRDEAAVTFDYSWINVAANSTISGPRGGSVSVSANPNAYTYPGSVIYIGVGPRAQVTFTPPTYVHVNTFGGVTEGGTDMTLAYKQLFLLSLQKFTMLAIDAAYTAPTAGAPFGGAGPKYELDPILTQPLPHNLGVTLALPIANFTTSSGRGWSIKPQFYPYWVSPGNTIVAAFVQHSFNPNTWPAAVFVGQQFGRHFELYAQYGGGSASVTTTGPVLGLFRATTNATATVFTIGVAALSGESNMPPAVLQMLAPTPKPTATP